MFRLHPALRAASIAIGRLGLSEVRLQRDRRFAWIVLVPRVAGAAALEDLTEADRIGLLGEIAAAGRAVRAMGEALSRPVERLNIGVLGNIVPQLHVHVVGRRRDDPAWPGPVWGAGEAEAYGAPDLRRALRAARASLASG